MNWQEKFGVAIEMKTRGSADFMFFDSKKTPFVIGDLRIVS